VRWLILLLSLASASTAVGKCLVAVDVGHDRIDFGTKSASGKPEWQFNLDTATAIYAGLRHAGIPAMLLAADGRVFPLAERPQRAEEAGATLFLSVHHDAAQERYLTLDAGFAYSDLFSGYGLFVSRRNPDYAQSIEVAKRIADGLLAAGLHPSLHHAEQIPGEGRPLLDEGRGVYRYDDLVVLRTATIPAVLLEAGVVINRADERLLATPEYRRILADAVVKAASAHCAKPADPDRADGSRRQ
jgi:N-acetylmuramoyl-L-alanine amidase